MDNKSLFHSFYSQTDIVANVTFTDDRQTASLLFDNFSIELPTSRSDLQTVRSYLFSLQPNGELPRPELNVSLRCLVYKAPGSIVKITVLTGKTIVDTDFPWGNSTDEDRSIELSLPAEPEASNKPLNLAIVIVAQRDTTTDSVSVTIDSIDIAPKSRAESSGSPAA